MNAKTVSPVDESTQLIFASIAVFLILFAGPFISFPIRFVLATALFTVNVGLYPDIYRSRNRSLIPAVCLLAFVWLCAALAFVIS